MGTLTLVRHAQASFLADDYDQLSALGLTQCQRLGNYWQRRDQNFDAIYLGSLKRHAQTLGGVDEALALAHLPLHVRAQLNEYDSQAIISALPHAALAPRDTPEGFKQHFRALREGLRLWMDGRLQPAGMPSYAAFASGIVEVAMEICQRHVGQQILLISSGGPISSLLGHVLGAAPQTTIDLNYQIRNTAVSEMRITPQRLRLVSFNALPHLDAPQDAHLHTHA